MKTVGRDLFVRFCFMALYKYLLRVFTPYTSQLLSLIAFACSVFRRTAKCFLANVLRLVTIEACDQDLNSSLGHTKKCFCKNCSTSCYLRRVWAHDTVNSR